jgi:hypothetical protein
MVDDARGADQEVQGEDPILTPTSPGVAAPKWSGHRDAKWHLC